MNSSNGIRSINVAAGVLVSSLFALVSFILFPWMGGVFSFGGITDITVNGIQVLIGLGSVLDAGGVVVALFIALLFVAIIIIVAFFIALFGLLTSQYNRSMSITVMAGGIVMLSAQILLGVYIPPGLGALLVGLISIIYIVQAFIPTVESTANVNVAYMQVEQHAQYVIAEQPAPRPQPVAPAPPPRPIKQAFPGTVMVDHNTGQQYQVFRGETLIGRSNQNDIVLQSKQVSRQHAVIREYNGRFSVENFGSKVGVRVNGQLIGSPCVLNSNDQITLGDVTLKFISGGY